MVGQGLIGSVAHWQVRLYKTKSVAKHSIWRVGYFAFFGLKNAIGVRKIILDVVFVVDFIFCVEFFSFFSETEFLRVVDFGC